MLFTPQEFAVLLATRESENARSLFELATSVEADLSGVHDTVLLLVQNEILRPLENYDGQIVYAYVDNAKSQRVYELIHCNRKPLLS